MQGKLRGLAKSLRQKATNAENLLWLFLKNRQLEGFKFRRQEPMGNFIADFVSHEGKIVIELDGGQHAEKNKKDKERDDWLKSQGYEVLRFWDNEVFKNKDGVLETIRKKLLSPHLTSPAADCVVTPSTLVGEGGDEGQEELYRRNAHPHPNPLRALTCSRPPQPCAPYSSHCGSSRERIKD